MALDCFECCCCRSCFFGARSVIAVGLVISYEKAEAARSKIM